MSIVVAKVCLLTAERFALARLLEDANTDSARNLREHLITDNVRFKVHPSVAAAYIRTLEALEVEQTTLDHQRRGRNAVAHALRNALIRVWPHWRQQVA